MPLNTYRRIAAALFALKRVEPEEPRAVRKDPVLAMPYGTERPPIVIIESPYAGNIGRNVAYARAAVLDSLERGEVPFASHLLYTQPGVLDDADPAQRQQGITASWRFMDVARRLAVYTDFGISRGMEAGIARAAHIGLEVEFRTLPNFRWPAQDGDIDWSTWAPRERRS